MIPSAMRHAATAARRHAAAAAARTAAAPARMAAPAAIAAAHGRGVASSATPLPPEWVKLAAEDLGGKPAKPRSAGYCCLHDVRVS